jgi:hypothetical protein
MPFFPAYLSLYPIPSVSCPTHLRPLETHQQTSQSLHSLGCTLASVGQLVVSLSARPQQLGGILRSLPSRLRNRSRLLGGRLMSGQSTETTTNIPKQRNSRLRAATLGRRHFILSCAWASIRSHAAQISNGIHLPEAKYAETGRCTCRSLAELLQGSDCP